MSVMDKLRGLALSTEHGTEPLPAGALTYSDLRALLSEYNQLQERSEKLLCQHQMAALDLRILAERILVESGK